MVSPPCDRNDGIFNVVDGPSYGHDTDEQIQDGEDAVDSHRQILWGKNGRERFFFFWMIFAIFRPTIQNSADFGIQIGVA